MIYDVLPKNTIMINRFFTSLFIVLLFSFSAKAQSSPALINDPDGFTYIRSGKGTHFESIGKIEKDEFFYCDSTFTDWWKVYVLKLDKQYHYNQLEGYVHKSRVQLLKDLSDTSQKSLINNTLSVFKKQVEIRLAFWNKYHQNKNKWKTSADSIASNKESEKCQFYSDSKYDPILNIIPQYFCKTKDTLMLQLFLATMWVDNGSANESPSYAIGLCFECQPELVIGLISKFKSKSKRDFFYDDIEFGLGDALDVDENGYSSNKEYPKLKKKLDNARKYKSAQQK